MLRGLPNIAYGVTWSVLGAFWFRGALMADWQGWWRIVPWLSIPFILAGFSFFFYPMRLGARARSTWYVITDQRVFICTLSKGRPPSVRVFSPQELAAMYLVKRPGRRQDLIFSPGAQENPQLKPRLESGFFGVEDGDEAAARVRTVLQAAASPPLRKSSSVSP